MIIVREEQQSELILILIVKAPNQNGQFDQVNALQRV